MKVALINLLLLSEILKHSLEVFREVFSDLSIWSVVLPVLIGLIYINKIRGTARIIWSISVFACIPQMVRFFYDHAPITFIVFNTYSVFEFFLIQFFFLKLLGNSREKRWIYFSSVLFIIYFSFLLLAIGFISRFLNEIVCFDFLIYTIGAFMILLKEFDQESTFFEVQFPDFYFLIGILLYSPVTVFIFSLWQYLQLHRSAPIGNIFIIHDVFNAIMYFLFAFGIYKSQSFNTKPYQSVPIISATRVL